MATPYASTIDNGNYPEFTELQACHSSAFTAYPTYTAPELAAMQVYNESMQAGASYSQLHAFHHPQQSQSVGHTQINPQFMNAGNQFIGTGLTAQTMQPGDYVPQHVPFQNEGHHPQVVMQSNQHAPSNAQNPQEGKKATFKVPKVPRKVTRGTKRSPSFPLTGPAAKKPAKRYRTVFTPLQLIEFEKQWEQSQCFPIARRLPICKTLKLPDIVVKNWFMNRKAKARRQLKARGFSNTIATCVEQSIGEFARKTAEQRRLKLNGKLCEVRSTSTKETHKRSDAVSIAMQQFQLFVESSLRLAEALPKNTVRPLSTCETPHTSSAKLQSDKEKVPLTDVCTTMPGTDLVAVATHAAPTTSTTVPSSHSDATSVANTAKPAAKIASPLKYAAETTTSGGSYIPSVASHYPITDSASQGSFLTAFYPALAAQTFVPDASATSSLYSSCDIPIDVTGVSASDFIPVESSTFLGSANQGQYPSVPLSLAQCIDSKPLSSTYENALLFPATMPHFTQWSPQDPFFIPHNINGQQIVASTNMQFPVNYNFSGQYYPQ